MAVPSRRKPLLDRFQQWPFPSLDLSSLQVRLTIQIALLFLLGLGGTSLWMGWQMQQLLIESHKQTVESVAMYIPHAVELYRKTLSVDASIRQTVTDVSSSDRLIWVRNPDGDLIAQSAAMDMFPELSEELLGWASLPIIPEIYHIRQRYLVVCGAPLQLQDQLLGKVYLAHDITDAQRRLNQGWQALALVSGLALLLSIAGIVLQLRRALQPLHHMSTVARAISAADLSTTPLSPPSLDLSKAPSEVKGLIWALNTMLVRLSETLDQQRQFVSNVSHELRTPLTVVYGYLQGLLRRSSNLTDYQQEALTAAASEADRTVRLLQDLLDLARADHRRLQFRQDPIVLNELIADIAAMAERVSDRPIQVKVPPTAVVIRADSDRLRQVLINLVDNAVKYSDAGTPIDLQVESTPTSVRIQVCDQGIGIPLHQQSQVFERFYRVDDPRTRAQDGTGLGLAIVKVLVEGMGGQITLRSKPGEGTVFTVSMPISMPM